MGTKTVWLGLVAMLMLGVLSVGAQDQPAPPREGDRNGGDRQQGRQFDREAFAQRIAERIKERLAVNDEEWAVISPRLTKVSDARRAVGSGRFGGMGGFGGRRDRGGDNNNSAAQRPALPDDAPATAKLAAKLNEQVENDKTDPAELKQTLSDLRAARKAAQQELDTAQASLRELLSVRQEAVLVSMGVLD